jgi:hypothetical protein
MKTCVHVWQYFAQFFLEWEMFQIKVIEKIKTHILCSITFFRKPCRLWDNVEKYGTARQATDDNIIRRMRFACWITKATGTHSEYLVLIAFPRQIWLRERAPSVTFIHTLLLLSCFYFVTRNSSTNFDIEILQSDIKGRHSSMYHVLSMKYRCILRQCNKVFFDK